VPVHLYGHPADLRPILDLAGERGLGVLEDACQAHGALYRGRTVGSIAPLGALSFYPTKNLGALGDGGAVLCRDAAHAARLRRLRNGGQSDRYRHEELGVNSRLDEVQAAILRVSLAHLPAWTERRRALASFYLRELEGTGLALPREQEYATAVYHLFVVRHPRRDELARALRDEGIGSLIHYPIPLHRQPAFGAFAGGSLPEAERAAGEILSLPLYPELTDAQAAAVVAAVRKATGSIRC
jgi:dTDP-4-amino-4,6-dideoxygalactose transaminase